MDWEAEYNTRARVADSAAILQRWERDAAAFRAAHRRVELALPYGDGAREKLDLFWPETGETKSAPVALFIHGGYWQALDRSACSMLARGLNARGIAVALPSYDLCPAVSVGHVVGQMRAASLLLHRRLGRRLLAMGHSAGGQLVAMLMATDWPALGGPARLVGAGLPISGIFELEPVRATSMGKALGLDAEGARRLSPRWLPSPGLPLHAVVGGAESDEFRRQTREFAVAWGGSAEEAAGANHFTVVEPLTDPGSRLVATAVALAETLARA